MAQMNESYEVYEDLGTGPEQRREGSAEPWYPVDKVGACQLVQLKRGMVRDRERDEPDPAHLREQRRCERPAKRVGAVVHEE